MPSSQKSTPDRDFTLCSSLFNSGVDVECSLMRALGTQYSTLKQGQELTNRCILRVAQNCPESPKIALERVTRTFPNLFLHFGHFRTI